MTQAHFLFDSWEFIGAEEYIAAAWRPANYVKGMKWTFHPQYFGQNKTIGDIIETTPTSRDISMPYVYDKTTQTLKIEVVTDVFDGVCDQSESDTYDVIISENQPSQAQIIKLCIKEKQGGPSTPFRYILQKVD